jgi:uncharacterized damage-inducible protein DinB
MPFTFTLDDLLAYSDWERDQWRGWFREQGAAALAVDLGTHNNGRIQNVGELVRHIFSAEKRYVERCRQAELTDTSTIPAGDIEALFGFGGESRRALRELLGSFPDVEWDAAREMSFGTHTRIVTCRKMILQAITHEIRHWAQIAAFLRQAGYKPGFHDLIVSPLFDTSPNLHEREGRVIERR